MNYQTFTCRMKEMVSDALGEDYRVELSAVPKNNGVTLDALMIYRANENIAPAIYLNHYYHSYLENMSEMKTAKSIIDAYFRSAPRFHEDLTAFTQFDNARPRIIYRLVNYEKNRAMLSDIPHQTFLNLALVYYIYFKSEQIGTGAVLVKNDLLGRWGADEKDLRAAAKENTQRILPSCFLTLGELMGRMGMTGTGMSEKEERELEEGAEFPLYALTNIEYSYGAYWITVPEVMRNICRRMGGDVYVLPSSVHECMIVPVRAAHRPEELAQLVRIVNFEEVDDQEILADCVYRCSKEFGTLQLCA